MLYFLLFVSSYFFFFSISLLKLFLIYKTNLKFFYRPYFYNWKYFSINTIHPISSYVCSHSVNKWHQNLTLVIELIVSRDSKIISHIFYIFNNEFFMNTLHYLMVRCLINRKKKNLKYFYSVTKET